ncbi:hypothetical protein L6452_01442 [Arctium lappa]|uniref:Uncharacterized protein n=1 Tax=Arctium lappa TaxID=4217 RepID=A0ACB9FGT0_ARCLA|nr:hypothetical protein L6452_01442 [Arctium lappa]
MDLMQAFHQRGWWTRRTGKEVSVRRENPKSKESVFATLCSTLSQAVLPAKPMDVIHDTKETSLEEKLRIVSQSENSNSENEPEKESRTNRRHLDILLPPNETAAPLYQTDLDS